MVFGRLKLYGTCPKCIPDTNPTKLHYQVEIAMLTQSNSATVMIALAIFAVLSGCTTVQPWERGNLAKPQMALDPYPLQSALRAHNYSSREAASAAANAQGGGCGCN